MIKKLRLKFVIYSIASIFIFLVLILLSINIANFSLVANSADGITAKIAENGGRYEKEEPFSPPSLNTLMAYENKPEPFSPEMKDSLRYFTFSLIAKVMWQKLNIN